ncbi:MAG: hypothetical protein KBC15_03755 [Candidatus Levybacteria bacterium]|nr:hypothetical protein [Candidatus Levybacteria bacterium]
MLETVRVGVCSLIGTDLTTVRLAVLDGNVVIDLAEATDDPFKPFIINCSGEPLRVEVRRWPEQKSLFVRAGESNSRLTINNQKFVAQLKPERTTTYYFTVWASVVLDPSFPSAIRVMEIPVSHYIVIVAGSSRYAALIGREENGVNPLVNRFLMMPLVDHEAALKVLQASTEPVDEEECQAAQEAMRIRLEMAHVGSGETSDHPEADGPPR